MKKGVSKSRKKCVFSSLAIDRISSHFIVIIILNFQHLNEAIKFYEKKNYLKQLKAKLEGEITLFLAINLRLVYTITIRKKIRVGYSHIL